MDCGSSIVAVMGFLSVVEMKRAGARERPGPSRVWLLGLKIWQRRGCAEAAMTQVRVKGGEVSARTEENKRAGVGVSTN